MSEAQNNKIVKYHVFTSLILGVLFLAILQSIALPKIKPIAFFSYVLGFSFIVFVYNKKLLNILNQYNFWKALRISLLILAGAIFFLAAPSPFLRGIFLLASVVVLAFYESTIMTFSENLLLNETLFSVFGMLAGLSAWAFLYTPQYRFFISLFVFAFVFLLSRCFFEYTAATPKAKTVSSLASSFLLAECFWAVGFLPQHFSVLAIALTAVYYSIVIINYHYLFKNLDFKKIQFHLLFSAFCILIVFLFTPWQII